MKKLLFLAIIFILAGGLINCAGGAKEKDPPKAIQISGKTPAAPVSTAIAVPQKEASVSASVAEKPSAGQEIFTLGEGIYRETPSAKGKIKVFDVRSWYGTKPRGGRWFEFSYQNISKNVLDVKYTIDWRDVSGKTIKSENRKGVRLLPGSDANIYELQYPDNAVSYEFWIEVEIPKKIPSSVKVSYIEHPSAKDVVEFVKYETEVREKSTPLEYWVAYITIKNLTKNELELKISSRPDTEREFQVESFALKPEQSYKKALKKFPYESVEYLFQVEVLEYKYQVAIDILNPKPIPFKERDVEFINYGKKEAFIWPAGREREDFKKFDGYIVNVSIKNISDKTIAIVTPDRFVYLAVGSSSKFSLRPGEVREIFYRIYLELLPKSPGPPLLASFIITVRISE